MVSQRYPVSTLAFLVMASLCGMQPINARSADTKIFFGTDAKRNEFPFVVYTNASNYYHGCTGTLIDRRWVLTTAQCLFYDTHVILGDYERPGNGGQEQVIVIEEEIQHPDYDSDTISNDVGLIKLASPANIRSDAIAKIQPLKSKAFMKKMLANEKSCRVLGWGLKDFPIGPAYTNKLQKLNVRFVNETEAAARGYEYVSQSVGAMATENIYTDKCETGGICFGDGGGPVVCKKRGEWVVTGLTSFFDTLDGCMRGVKGTVNVQLYYSWIQSIIDQ